MKTITGYQYGDRGQFIGPYTFPDNLDQEAVHLPPRTVLQAPPTALADGEAAFFDEAEDAWVIREHADPIATLQAQHAAKLLADAAIAAEQSAAIEEEAANDTAS